MEKNDRQQETEERKSLERITNTQRNQIKESYFEHVAKSNVILRAKVGSQLYGTSTPESDTDYAGIFMPSLEMFFGMDKCKQVSLGTNAPNSTDVNTAEDIDEVRYTLERFFELAMSSNPTIIELFFVPPGQIIDWDARIWPKVANNYDLFISKKLFDSFLGYATQQERLMTTKTERYNALIEMEKFFKLLLEKGHTKLNPLHIEALTQYADSYKTTKNVPRKYEAGQDIQRLYNHTKEEMERYGHRRHNIIKYGFECYHKDTEFLTDTGWKKYDEITNEKLGTLKLKDFSLEFLNYSNRIKKTYDGTFYKINNIFSEMVLTENHNMLVSSCHRNKKNNFSTKYDESIANWEYLTCKKLNENTRSWYHIINTIKNNNNNDYDIEDEYLVLLGAFVTEGSFRRRNGVEGIRISQTDKGKLEFFKKLKPVSKKYNLNIFDNKRKDFDLTERLWFSNNNTLTKKILKDCGDSTSINRKLPSWITKLSKRQANILLKTMLLGDGTERKDCFIYYTASKNLADNFQILGLLACKNATVRGPYKYSKNESYQVYLSKKEFEPNTLFMNTNARKTDNRKTGNIKYKSKDDVVCFETKNNNLITRFNGKISIQGNCKFGSHLVRLLMEGIELATTGKITYPLKESKYLLEIKQGKYTLEEVLKRISELKEEFREAEINSKLQSLPRYKEINQLLIELTKEFHDI